MATPAAAAAVAGTSGTSPEGPAAKRAKTSDLTQPADKKSRTVVPSEPDSRSHGPPSSGIITLITNRFSSPFPCASTAYVPVLTANFTGYFKSLWTSLVEVIYPDQNYVTAHVISEDNFVKVCRYLTKARVDQVYSSASGRRPTSRVPIPRDFPVPKSLADIINGIGVVTILSGSFAVIPEPEAPPADPTAAVSTFGAFNILSSFSTLVKAANARGFINVGTISSVTEGTAWWLLTARNPDNPANIANEIDSAVVYGIFKEWTPADGVFAAIVQSHFDGSINEIKVLQWAFDTVRGISGLRREFNISA